MPTVAPKECRHDPDARCERAAQERADLSRQRRRLKTEPFSGTGATTIRDGEHGVDTPADGSTFSPVGGNADIRERFLLKSP